MMKIWVEKCKVPKICAYGQCRLPIERDSPEIIMSVGHTRQRYHIDCWAQLARDFVSQLPESPGVGRKFLPLEDEARLKRNRALRRFSKNLNRLHQYQARLAAGDVSVLPLVLNMSDRQLLLAQQVESLGGLPKYWIGHRDWGKLGSEDDNIGSHTYTYGVSGYND